jgi:nitrilase
MSDNKHRIAAIQMASGPKVEANLLEVERLVNLAVASGAQLVLLPESFAFMGKTDEAQLEIAEEDGQGPIQDFLAQLAKRLRVWIVSGTLPMRTKGKRVRAACLVFDDQGQRQARYDKIHLFDVDLLENDEHYRESAVFEPGREVVTLDTPFGRLGLAVCYDLRFPELFRRLMAEQPVDILCLPAAFTAYTGKAHWEVLLRARAIENLSYLVAAAQGGFHLSGRETYGHSMLIDPWGQIMAEAQSGSGVVTADIDLDYLRATRRHFPALDHRCRGEAIPIPAQD